MLRLAPRFRVFFAFGSTLLLTATLIGQEPTKHRFKVVPFAELTKAADKKEIEPSAVLLEGLNRLGKSKWEAMSEGERGIVFRASTGEWEYRLVRAPESTLNGKSDDDEVLQLVLDGLSTNGWELCAARLLEGKHLVFKRASSRYLYEIEGKKQADPRPSLVLPTPGKAFPDKK